jgi:hypothetical protein
MTERTTVEILKAARKRIEDPLRWTQGYDAVTAIGTSVEPCDAMATCWCTNGAVCKEVGAEYGDQVYERAWNALCEATEDDERDPIDVNDELTHGDVLAMFDRAIAAEEEKAKEGGPT